ncbi:uncharacterized protein KIAA0513 homolog isoform X2 [Thalassophryne amazonica]|nr:uncharacterized protein KIAA0513 homolog isoform X2 [Thalassophryne amazonica]
MDGMTGDNLKDFDLSVRGNVAELPGHTDGFSAHPLFSMESQQELLLPEPMAIAKPGLHHHDHEEECDNEGDATESADSENDVDSPSHAWALRWSSSSSIHNEEDADLEITREFMKAYVEKVFNGKEDFDQEEKAHFGELCTGENGKGREWFAKYVNAQRCHSKCVSEAVFYRLVQSFAVVLFECYQTDDYSPAKNLMTMCFTFYYIGKSPCSPSELLDRRVPSVTFDSYVKKANSWLSGKKIAAGFLLKNNPKTDMKGFFGDLESKLRNSVVPKTEMGRNPAETKSQAPVSEAPVEKKEEKLYLYTHLKQQPIWHTLRFWNAAFFDAVHYERKKRSPTTR